MRKAFMGFVAGVFVWSLAAAASADVERSEWATEGGSHIFKDDPLNALGQGAQGVQIKVRPPKARTYLLRARTSFVPEMLKSVEKM
jgi:hypothetical protein